MPQGIPGNDIENFIKSYEHELTDQCKAAVRFNAKDGKLLDQYVMTKKLGIRGKTSTQLLGVDRYFTTKGTGEVEFTPLSIAKQNIKYRRKNIYISTDLKALLESLKPQHKKLLDAAILMSLKVGTGKKFDKKTQRDPFIKELANGDFQLTSGRTISELRPQLFCETKHISGDVRFVGWEQENGYYFTEFGLHKHIGFNILKVISCLAEGERIEGGLAQKHGGILEQNIQSRLDALELTSKDIQYLKEANQKSYNNENLEESTQNVRALEAFKEKLEINRKTSWAERFMKQKYQAQTALTDDIKQKSKDFCKQVTLRRQEEKICMI